MKTLNKNMFLSNHMMDNSTGARVPISNTTFIPTTFDRNYTITKANITLLDAHIRVRIWIDAMEAYQCYIMKQVQGSQICNNNILWVHQLQKMQMGVI